MSTRLGRRFVLRTSAAIVAALLVLGCDGGFETRQALEDVNSGRHHSVGSRPTCEVQPTNYVLDTRMVAFELKNSFGFNMGFDLLSGLFKLFELSFTARRGQITLAMSLFDPVAPNYELMNSLGGAQMRGSEFKFGLNYDQIAAGFNFFSQTPVTKLAERALDETLSKLNTDITGLQEPWSSQVLAIPTETEVVIPSGSFAGVQAGDEFVLYNVDHVWDGIPCKSNHLFARKTTTKPLATAVATQVQNMASVLKITTLSSEGADDEFLMEGARVEILRLPGDNRRLARSLEVRSVVGGQMQFQNGQAVDLSPYLREQIRAVVHRHGYLVYAP